MPREKQETVAFPARFPPEVYDALRAESAASERSVNQVLVSIVREALGVPVQPKPVEPPAAAKRARGKST